MPKKSTEFVVRVQPKGGKVELAGPYWQRRDAVRALPKLLEGFKYDVAVRAVVYERPARDGWRTPAGRDDPKQWTAVAHAEKVAGGRSVRITETRAAS